MHELHPSNQLLAVSQCLAEAQEETGCVVHLVPKRQKIAINVMCIHIYLCNHTPFLEAYIFKHIVTMK